MGLTTAPPIRHEFWSPLIKKKKPMRGVQKGSDHRRNRQIRVPEVRLIGAEGEQHGVIQTRDAQRMAEEAGLDLVEVQPTARPPVCKIMDWGKFKYMEAKRSRGQATKKTASSMKEMRVRPAIDTHDLGYRMDQGRKFLEAGHKVQVVCIFRGRQMRHPEHGYAVMRTVAETLADTSKVESPAKMMGRRMTMMLSPGAAKPGVNKPAPSTPRPAARPAAAPRPAPTADAAPSPDAAPAAKPAPETPAAETPSAKPAPGPAPTDGAKSNS